MTESLIQKMIIEHLRAAGYSAWRMNLGGVRRSGKGMTANPLRGFPDIFGILKNRIGVMFAIEVKTQTGKVAPHQQVWIDDLNRVGAVAFVARSVNDVREALRDLDRVA